MSKHKFLVVYILIGLIIINIGFFVNPIKAEEENNSVIISNESPINNSNLYTFLSEGDLKVYLDWNATFVDPDGDLFIVNITCSNGDTVEYVDCVNGSYNLNITNLVSETEYIVWVNATDGFSWTNNSYNYTTIIETIPPIDETNNPLWKLVSLPYNGTLHKYNVNVSNSTNWYNWTNAVSNGIILNFVYGWNLSMGSGFYDVTDYFEPYKGYWMYFYDSSYNITINITTGDGETYNTSVTVYDNMVNVTGTYEYLYDQGTGFHIWLNLTGYGNITINNTTVNVKPSVVNPVSISIGALLMSPLIFIIRKRKIKNG